MQIQDLELWEFLKIGLASSSGNRHLKHFGFCHPEHSQRICELGMFIVVQLWYHVQEQLYSISQNEAVI